MGNRGPTGPEGPPVYTPQPGLTLKVASAAINMDRTIDVVVTATVVDGAILPLDQLDRLRVMVAAVKTSTDGSMLDRWVSYVLCPAAAPHQATLLPCGETMVQGGRLSSTATLTADMSIRYRLHATAPMGYDTGALHRIAIEGRRAYQGVTEFAEAHLDLIPSGMPATTRQLVTTEACDQCHHQISAHGGNRSDTSNCVTCHTTQLIDVTDGQVLAFDRLIHMVHRGADLPSVMAGTPFVISGFMGMLIDFSTIHFPQDIRNCDTCHQGTDADRWSKKPSREACGSCHDRTWFGPVSSMPATWVAHYDGLHPQANDVACTGCHTDRGGLSGVIDRHLLPTAIPGAPTFALAISRITAIEGQSPIIEFTMADRADNMLTSTIAIARLAATMAGPTSDYATEIQNTVIGGGRSGTLANLGGGSYRYTYGAIIPSTASGTWGFGLEGYRAGTLADGTTYRYGAKNPVIYADVGGGNAVPRRTVVQNDKCDSCHKELAVHGNNRDGNTQYCVMCHNPTATDAAMRPVSAGPPASIDFKVMIHKIHRGKDLPSLAEGGPPYVIYGYGHSINDFSKVGFPGKLELCTTCHATGTEIEPSTAVCTSCHDDQASVGHAELNTTPSGVETCAVCHGPTGDFAVEKVHAP
jgi:OmcA/MtrC family decaheme c-type cytochrome